MTMKGTEKIIARINAEAKAEAQSVLEKAAALAAEIAEKSKAAAQEDYWNAVRAGVRECEALAARRERIAGMEAKKDILALKQQAVSDAFDRAEKMLTELPESDYVALLASLAAEAAGTGLEEVLFNERDKARCAKAVCAKANELLSARGKYGKLTVAEETADISGGLIVRQGGIETNCSIETLVQLRRGELSAAVAAALFE